MLELLGFKRKKPMFTITMPSPKGGAGKTTTTYNLAVYLQSLGKEVLVIDTDPQASISKIADERASDTPVFHACPTERVAPALETARESGADVVFIDTRGESERAILVATRSADLVLIPSSPSILEVNEVKPALEYAQMAQKTPFVLLNRVSPLSRTVFNEAVELFRDELGVDTVPCYISDRVDFKHSLLRAQSVTEYNPSGKASGEVRAVGDWIVENFLS